jgi:hypothetical protein
MIASMIRIAAEINDRLVVSTSEVGNRLGFKLTATFLKSLGLVPYMETACGVFWLQEDLESIRDELVYHLLDKKL